MLGSDNDGNWENGDLEDDDSLVVVSKEGEDTEAATERVSEHHESKYQKLSCREKAWECVFAACAVIGTLCFLFFSGEGPPALRNILAMATVVNYCIYIFRTWKIHQRSQERHSAHSYIELVKPKSEMAPLINLASDESCTKNGEAGGNFVVVLMKAVTVTAEIDSHPDEEKNAKLLMRVQINERGTEESECKNKTFHGFLLNPRRPHTTCTAGLLVLGFLNRDDSFNRTGSFSRWFSGATFCAIFCFAFV
jgi:hypothetical protein